YFGIQLTNTLQETTPDATLVAFTLGLSFLSVALFSALPSQDASRIPLYSALRGGAALGGESHSSLRSRGWLAAAKLALCLPLLVGAGLLIQTVDNLFS